MPDSRTTRPTPGSFSERRTPPWTSSPPTSHSSRTPLSCGKTGGSIISGITNESSNSLGTSRRVRLRPKSRELTVLALTSGWGPRFVLDGCQEFEEIIAHRDKKLGIFGGGARDFLFHGG